jgi:hypothetical protein
LVSSVEDILDLSYAGCILVGNDVDHPLEDIL